MLKINSSYRDDYNFLMFFLIGRIGPIRSAFIAAIRLLYSTPIAKTGRTGNSILMGRVVDAAAVVAEV